MGIKNLKNQIKYCFAMKSFCEKRKDWLLAQFYNNAQKGFEQRLKRESAGKN